MAELPLRARQILYAAITEFVATGEPVGSRTLSKKGGIELSPASIRNVLADLEEGGYLKQPHTSAGRVPTDRAFRLFIDALMQTRELSQEDHARIRSRFEDMEPGQDLMRESGKLLAELTGTAAVVVAPRAQTLTIRHLRFLVMAPGELLAVMVMSNGVVQNRFLRGIRPVNESELTRVHNLLDDVAEGRTLAELRDFFLRRLQTERVQQDDLRRRAFELGEAAVAIDSTQDARPNDVFIEGSAMLLGQPEFADAEGMKQVVRALDERERLVELLEATMAPREAAVVVGHEAGELGGGQLSIVSAMYTQHGLRAGTVGVIGPTRMDYPKVVPLVAATANAMSEYMGTAAGGGGSGGGKSESSRDDD